PRVILLGRLSLYGRRAERLHEELVPVAARWVERAKRTEPLKRYAAEAETKTLELLEKSLDDKGLSVPDDTITRKLLASASYEVRAKRVEPVGLVYLWPESN